MKPTIKYVRTEDRKVIIVPTKEGLDILTKKFQSVQLSTDTIAGKEVAAYVFELAGAPRFFKQEIRVTENEHLVHVYHSADSKVQFKVKAFVEVKEEKKNEDTKAGTNS